ncbi:MAG: GDSL family lipase, partial [Vallitaleaceae bacterium]|nr:GDSL family lipase [Vallitaleaceae bacterium]
MIKKIIWYSVVTISVLGIIAFSTGFYKAIRLTTGTTNGAISSEQNTQSPNDNPIEKPANSLSLITLGDSVAKGTGDETNRGFAGNLKDLMNSKTSKDVMVENLGIDGLRSGNLLEEVQTGKLDAVIKTSDFILLSIGGNDLRTLQNQDEPSKVKDVIEIQNQTISDLKEIISHIREINKNATIIFVGLYNPNVKTGSYVDGELVRSWNF